MKKDIRSRLRDLADWRSGTDSVEKLKIFLKTRIEWCLRPQMPIREAMT